MQKFLRGDAQLVASFTEVESDKENERPQLAAMIARAKQEGAMLLVAKLDRLARSVAFFTALIERRFAARPYTCPRLMAYLAHYGGRGAKGGVGDFHSHPRCPRGQEGAGCPARHAS